MATIFFWDIENVSFHNLHRIMIRVNETAGEVQQYVVFSKIKESRKIILSENKWILVPTHEISKNSADYKIKEMIYSAVEIKNLLPEKIFLITEDKGYFKICREIISKGIKLEIITGTKNPQWIKDLANI